MIQFFSYYKFLGIKSLICIVFISVCCSTKKNGESVNNQEIESQVSDSVFVFQKYKLTIGIPKTWTPQKLSESIFVFRMDCDSSRIFCPNIAAQFTVLDQNQTLRSYTETYFYHFQEKYKTFHLVSSLDKQANDFQMKIVDYKMFEQNTNFGGTTAIIKCENSDQLLILSIMAENDESGSYVKYRRLFENILNSIRKLT